MTKPTLKQIWQYARADLKPVPPSPHEVALRCAAAILGSGKFGDDMTAPMDVAWRCVLPFYAGQKAYLEQGAMMFQMSRHASEPEMTSAEAYSYVTGGETGNMGEAGASSFTLAVQSISAEEAASNLLRQIRISECDQAMFAADAELRDARAAPNSDTAGHAARVKWAAIAWDAAAKAQSEAHSWTPPADQVAEAVARAQN